MYSHGEGVVALEQDLTENSRAEAVISEVHHPQQLHRHEGDERREEGDVAGQPLQNEEVEVQHVLSWAQAIVVHHQPEEVGRLQGH